MLHIGVIGCGDVAFSSYLPGLSQLQDRVQVVACFDIRQAQAEKAAARYQGAQAYTDYATFLRHQGMEAVINLTPAPLHYEISEAALRAGLHVYTEKPLASSIQKAQALAELARQQDRVFLSAPAIMVTPRFRWIKGLMTEQRIGRPTLITAQTIGMGPAAWRQYSGDPAVFYQEGVGPLVDTGVYLLHAVTGLLGPARRVQAFGGIAIPERKTMIPARYGETVEVKTNDHMLLHLDFGGNTFAQVLSSFAVPRTKAPMMEIHCTDGSISISLEAWYQANGPVDVFLRDDSIHGLDGWVSNVAPPTPSAVTNGLIGGVYHFVDVLQGREKPVLTSEHATHVLEIMLSAEASTREGRAIELQTSF